MKLNEFFQKPLNEVLSEFEMVDCKIRTDDSGNVCSVELKYTPHDTKATPQKEVPVRRFL